MDGGPLPCNASLPHPAKLPVGYCNDRPVEPPVPPSLPQPPHPPPQPPPQVSIGLESLYVIIGVFVAALICMGVFWVVDRRRSADEMRKDLLNEHKEHEIEMQQRSRLNSDTNMLVDYGGQVNAPLKEVLPTVMANLRPLDVGKDLESRFNESKLFVFETADSQAGIDGLPALLGFGNSHEYSQLMQDKSSDAIEEEWRKWRDDEVEKRKGKAQTSAEGASGFAAGVKVYITHSDGTKSEAWVDEFYGQSQQYRVELRSKGSGDFEMYEASQVMSEADRAFECVRYCRHEEAGLSEELFNVPGQGWIRRDCDEDGNVLEERKGKTLKDFVDEARKKEGDVKNLQEVHVLTLRIYTTLCFEFINAPFRKAGVTTKAGGARHPLPLTVLVLKEAIQYLRKDSMYSLARDPTLLPARDNGRRDSQLVTQPLPSAPSAHEAPAEPASVHVPSSKRSVAIASVGTGVPAPAASSKKRVSIASVEIDDQPPRAGSVRDGMPEKGSLKVTEPDIEQRGSMADESVQYRRDRRATTAVKYQVLWRGMKNTNLPEDWSGGCVAAPMSTTRKLDTALSYAASHELLIFRIKCKSNMQLPASLQFLSCFPSEDEWLVRPTQPIPSIRGSPRLIPFSSSPSHPHWLIESLVRTVPTTDSTHADKHRSIATRRRRACQG